MLTIRTGMWVVHGERVAIVTRPPGGGVVALDYVNGKGETVASGRAPLDELRQARLGEIPRARIAGTPPSVLRGFGYV